MKNLKSIALVLIGLATLTACGGKQNSEEVAANEGAVLAVRTFEDLDGTEQEGMTEVAILEGNFDTPEQAQIAAEGAQWSDISNFEMDDEVDFETIDNTSALLSEQARGDRFDGDGRRGDRDGRARDDDRRRRGDRDGRARDDRRRDDRARGDDRRPSRRFRDRGHNDRNWRPNNYRNRWQRRPFRPAQHNFYGFQRCTYRYIYRNGRCYRPVSRRWGYQWSHGWGYTSTYHGPRRRQNSSQLRVRVRFFL